MGLLFIIDLCYTFLIETNLKYKKSKVSSQNPDPRHPADVKNKTTEDKMKYVLFLAYSAIIAAAYAVLTIIFAPISYGPIQLRLSEALTILPYFTSAAIPGLTIGCFIANLWGFLSGTAFITDVFFGTIATLLSAVFTFSLRKLKYGKFLAPLPPVIFNALIVGAVIAYATTANIHAFYTAFLYYALTIGLGELLACYILGLPLLFVIEKYKYKIFK